MPGTDPVYIAARSVLLDALTALGPHRDAVILVGAQAIYIRVGDADIAVAPTTSDGDLALNPDELPKSPEIHRLMEDAGFQLRRREHEGPLPGIWEKRADSGHLVSVDLLVPETVAPPGGRRAARLTAQHKRVALKVAGIEGALVDNDPMTIEDVNRRSYTIRVAGPASLLVAKVFKIHERSQEFERLKDKDALDILRLLRGTSTDEMAARTARILSDHRSAEIGRRGLDWLRELFAVPSGQGVQMALRATESLEDADLVSATLVALTNDLLRRI